MVVNGNSIGGFWCLLLVIILMAINGYYISDYRWLSYYWLLVVIPLMVIGGHSIDGY
jgi:hypothetical protein